jgi:pepF/M3 family oligoendopeptidase
MKTLETARLILRNWQLEDALDLYAYASDPSVGPQAGWAPHKNVEESQKIVQLFIAHNDVWALQDKVSGKVIGSVGLHERTGLTGQKAKTLGYVLSPKYQGLGLMTEACSAVIRYVFNETDLDLLAVDHFLHNEKSRRVIEKCGFCFLGIQTITTSDGRQELVKYYHMTRKDYQKTGGQPMNHWSLENLYQGFEDPHFSQDFALLDEWIRKINQEDFSNATDREEKLVAHLQAEIAMNTIATKLFCFCALRQSTNTTDAQTNKYLNSLQMRMTELTNIDTLFVKWLAQYEGLDQSIAQNPFLKEHEFLLKKTIEDAKYLLDEKMEVLIAKLQETGSQSWDRLQGLLTSTLSVDYNGKQITLSQVRNLAYDADPEVRKNAYLAELASYKAIEKPVSFALNGIKGEVNTITALRGYSSPLEEALTKSRMKRETLDAMFAVCGEYLPVFRAYLKQKALLLGHKNGLPFFDLFAPIGKNNRVYSIPEAKEFVLKNFHTFNERLYLMAKKAFEKGWIDFDPREGKVGGAFCENIHPIGESRILTNFTGMFGDLITLSHELGHAYHGECIFQESILNGNYTMPVAETASTFCETIVNQAALQEAESKEEKISLLESSIQDYTQVIVDIMSRFLFESKVFDGRKETIYDENELKELMLDAQRQTYGDGLDPDYLHPYMWLCKSHYYSGSLSFYNFPYAFGLLFAKGLYAQYRKDKTAFVAKYDTMLAATGKRTVEDVAQMMGIDVTQKAFWIDSLELLKQDIETFIDLTK